MKKVGSRLTLKLFRDLWSHRWQFAAVAVMVALGVGIYIGSLMSYENLRASYALSYRRLQFADFWLEFSSAPREVVEEMRRWPGMRALEGRWAKEAAVDQPQKPVRRMVARLISLPGGHPPQVNQVRVQQGRYLSRSGRGEVLMAHSFAETHGYAVGDFITLEVDGVRHRLRIVGIVKTPEYILTVRNKEYLMPVPHIFGVLFITHQEAERLFRRSGEINELCAITEPQRRDSLMAKAYRRLKPYGAREPTPREEQPSNRLLQQDLEGFRKLADVFPVLFLLAAGLTIYSLLMRIVNAQRLQMGFLRAVGFGRGAILRHYCGFAVVIALVGGVLGILLGIAMAGYITSLYARMLHIPFLDLRPRLGVLLRGVLLGMAFTGAGGFMPAWSASRVSPAEAMREQYTAFARQPWLEKKWPFLGRLPYLGKIPFRNLFRSRRRTLSTLLGVASGVALILASMAFLDATEDTVRFYFDRVMLFDLEVFFIPHQSEDILSTIERMEGVVAAEPTFQVPVELERQGVHHSTLLWGVPRRPRLLGLTDWQGAPLPLTPGWLLMTQNLRRKLQVEAGDKVAVRYSFSKPEEPARMTLQATSPPLRQPLGSLVYVNIDTARKAFGRAMEVPARAITSALVKTKPGMEGEVEKRLTRLERAGGVLSAARTRKEVHEMLKFTYTFVGVMVFFGCTLTFGIVFNVMNINVLERLRELATLQSLGFTPRWVMLLLTLENLITVSLGIGAGLPLGYGLASYLFRLYSNELVEFRLVLFPRTYLLTAVSVLLSALLSQIPSLQTLSRLDLAKATKEVAG